MKQERAKAIAERLLRAFGLRWSVRLVNFAQPYRLGLCRYGCQTIELSIRHVEEDPDDYVVETIAEETAHAITPGDTNHGTRWKTAYENIKAMLAADAEEQAVITALINEHWNVRGR